MIAANLIRTEVASRTPNARARARYRLRHPDRVKKQDQTRQAKLTVGERKTRAMYAREWRKIHPGYDSCQSQKWREAHPEEWKRLQAQWRKTPKGVEARRAWDRGEIAKAGKAIWRAKNPEKAKAIEHRRNHTRRARLYAVTRAPYDFAEILRLSGDRCAYQLPGCQWIEDPKAQLTADHVIPVSKGGGDTFENVLPACASCNKRKGSRLVEPKFRVSHSDSKDAVSN